MNAKANQHHEIAQELHEGLYLAAKKSKIRVSLFECVRKEVIKKPYGEKIEVARPLIFWILDLFITIICYYMTVSSLFILVYCIVLCNKHKLYILLIIKRN